MKRQWLIILAATIVFVCMALNVFATETRVTSMGQTGIFMYDNSNIVIFPGAVMRYGNEIVTELRLKDVESVFSAEVRLPMNSYMFGFNFNRPITLFDPGVGQSIVLNSTSDLYFGTQLAGNDLGIRASLGRDGFTRDSIPFGPPRLEESARYFEVAAGYSTDLYDASISLELPSVKSEEGGLKDEFSGNMIMLNGRYFYDYDEKMRFVPVVRFGFGSGSRKTDVGGGNPQEETDYGLFSLNLGIGLNYQISDNSILVFAIDPYGYYRLKEDEKNVGEGTTTTTTFPRLYLGAENDLVAVDINTTEIKWKFPTEDSVTSSPAIDSSTIYIGSQDGRLYAVDKNTGEKLWDYLTGGEITSSPAVINGKVYVGSHDGKVYAFE